MKSIPLHPPNAAWKKLERGSYTLETMSDGEHVAAVLAGIKEDLEHTPVTDPEVWDDYPYVDGPRYEDDEHQPYGLLAQLEELLTHDPTTHGMAQAIEIAFRLGRASITGTPDEDETQRILAGIKRLDGVRKRAGSTTGGYTKRDAEDGHKALKKWWAERRGFCSDHEMAREACVDKRITKLGDDRARALFREWAREADDATERDTWATEGWIASESPKEKKFPPNQRPKSGWTRGTRDNLTVLLFEEDGRWRCRVNLFDIEKDRVWFWEGRNAESPDEAKTESYTVVKEIREHMDHRKKWRSKLWARWGFADKAPPDPLKKATMARRPKR